MKRAKKLKALFTLLLVTFLLTGCLSIDMNVKSNGSMDMTYTIDTSQTQGMLSFKTLSNPLKNLLKT
jgi:PBP1b-binding outer membrane lipoprotein LpoB